MAKIRKYLLVWVLLLVCLLSKAQDSTILTVIGNVKGTPMDLKMSELKKVFRGEKDRWNDGTKVVIAMVKPTTSLGKIISQKVYSMSPDELNSFWLSFSFKFSGSPPKTFNNVGELEIFVSETPGAIAILNKTTTVTDIKTILIDNKKSF